MTLHYEEHGNQRMPLIMFIHGGGVSGWMWDKQVQCFSDYHCIVPNLVNDESSQRGLDFSINNHANVLLDLIAEKANGKTVIIVGFSLGAQIALQMISLKPQLLDYAIINSALVKPQPFMKRLIKPIVKLTFPLIKNKLFAKTQANALYIGHEYFDLYYQETSKMKMGTLIKVLEENMSFNIPENFSQASCKILVTVGEKEKRMMKKSAVDIVNSNPNCKGVVLPNVGHGVSLAMPDFFNEIVENWVNNVQLPEGKVIK
ncbi:alpha/beta hydrolase [Amphibacillus indicireducens]|uniref:Alpha/beta hydrolase n=1 Tax=Amphibacillus indicireducens TaxID=1076330 RepID=A0ABP7V4B5_9BACI